MSSVLVANERAKLSATYINGMALTVLGVGGLAPLFAYAYSGDRVAVPLSAVVGVSAGCLLSSVALHFVGRRVLGAMR